MSIPTDDASPARVAESYAHLLSLAAHEFRTPASVVAGYLRMLQKDTETPLTERQRKMVDEAAKSCARLVALVSELSEIGKLDSGHATTPAAEPIDLFTLVDEVARNMRDGEDRAVRIEPGGPGAGALISGGRQRLSDALTSILKALVREQATAATLVCDRRFTRGDGVGSAIVIIARSDDVQRAYEAMPRSFDEARGGVGLSLPIARRVIEQAGGRLWSPTPRDANDRGLYSAAIMSFPLRA